MKNLISDKAKVGKNTTIEYGAVISEDVIIGDNCFIGYHTIVRPGVVIGDNTEIRSLCFVAEGASIGSGVKVIQLSNICKDCVIEDDVFFGTGVLTFDTKRISHKRGYKPVGQPPHIERGARIGSGVCLYPDVVVGRNSMIYAGSLVTKSTEPYGIYRGQPAVKIGEVPKDERI
jgi:acetyltransferase-like isoleucine patch superfamily enzyme